MRGNLLPLNLQFFAADAAADTAEPAAEGAAADVADATGADSGAVQDAVDSAEGKKDAAGGWKEGIADGRVPAADVQKLVQEEMKKAAMPPEERAKYEADEREKSLKEREAAISLRERTAEAKELLAENGLPASFTEMVVGEDKAATEKNVKAIKTKFDEAVQAQVEKRLSGKTPDAGSGVSGSPGDDAMMAEILRCFK